MCWSQDDFFIAAEGDLHEDVVHGFGSAGLVPEFEGLDGGHEEFERACGVHFVADDLFGFLEDAESEREVGICACAELADHARAEEEPMAWSGGFGGGFLLGRDEGLGPAQG